MNSFSRGSISVCFSVTVEAASTSSPRSSTLQREEGRPPPFLSSIHPSSCSSSSSSSEIPKFPPISRRISCRRARAYCGMCRPDPAAAGQEPTGRIDEERVLESSLEGAIFPHSLCTLLEVFARHYCLGKC
ncbi:unnamed protein product [Victoria cruziana]